LLQWGRVRMNAEMTAHPLLELLAHPGFNGAAFG